MIKPVVLFLFVLGLADAQAPPPIGSLIDVGGYRVHLYCTGEGSPTVMVAGGFSVDWDLVQSQVAKFTRICTYDVSGTAWSDPGPASTCKERVTEIHKLLNNAGVKGPFVLVGFSVGGLVVRYYAGQYPNEVSGMVIVDHAFTPSAGGRPTAPSSTGDSPPVLIFQTPITFTAEETSDFKKLPERMRELHRWGAARKPVIDHAATADDCLVQLSKSASPGSMMPLVVISTGNQARGYKELQTELLSLSSRSQQMKAERSFHSVEIDQPEVVIEGIRRVVDQVRRPVPSTKE